MNATEVGAHGSVDLEGLFKFGQDIGKAASFEGAAGGADLCSPAIAVHWIALPDGYVARGLNSSDVRGEVLGDFAGAVAGYQGHFPDFAIGVEDVEEWGNVVWRHTGANFYANWITETTEEFDMSIGKLAGPVTDPEEVTGCIVIA